MNILSFTDNYSEADGNDGNDSNFCSVNFHSKLSELSEYYPDIISHTKLKENCDNLKEEIKKVNLSLPPNFKPFHELPTSTSTEMAYSNLHFHREEIFKSITITEVQVPLTKKKKNIDKKKLKAPYGSIIGIQYGLYFRGVRLSKRKRYWCPRCQLRNVKTGKIILSVEEYDLSITQSEIDELGYPEDTRKIYFKCTVCTKDYKIEQLRKIMTFLNQLTIGLALDGIIINIMNFKDNFKLAGNKHFNHAVETMMIMWETYIQPNPECWEFRDNKTSVSIDENKFVERVEYERIDAHFLFDGVMKNVDFHLGFAIDKKKLNNLMNEAIYSNIVHISSYETTSSTHVNIELYSVKPEDYKYYVLSYENAGIDNPVFLKSQEKLYARKKPQEDRYTTLIVFSSGEVILTGRYAINMEEAYLFFVNTALQNKDIIKEVVSKPNKPLRLLR